jgi:glycosyltransferase involved in cell wall biosynthesis
MTKPMISVLMPVYNASKYLREAIESILGQTYQDFEFLIVNDGSTDSSEKIIAEYAKEDNRIRCITQPNGGVASALNAGLEQAIGDYVVRMDADDVSYPRRLETLVRYMEGNPQVDICGSGILQNGVKRLQMPLKDADIKAQMLLRNPMIHPTVIFRKTYLDTYRVCYHLVKAEDYDLWVRCASTAIFANLPDSLLMYRMHDANVSINHFDIFETEELRIQQMYCENLGVKDLPRVHYLNNLFTVDDLLRYEKALVQMVQENGWKTIPYGALRRIMRIDIETRGGMVKAYRSYHHLLQDTNGRRSLSMELYIFFKSLQRKLKSLEQYIKSSGE